MEQRFDQQGHKIYCKLEQLLIKACTKGDFEDKLKVVCDFYKDDLNPDDLKAQLLTFGIEFHQNCASDGKVTIFAIKDHFNGYSNAQQDLLKQVEKILQFTGILVSK